MKRISCYAFVLLGVFACKNTAERPGEEEPAPEAGSYEPIPAGYGYLQDTDKLEAAVRTADIAYIRDHGWKLWAGIMQPASNVNGPVWYTWPNTFNAFQAEKPGPLGATEKEEEMVHSPKQSLIQTNLDNLNFSDTSTIIDSVPLPIYPIPKEVIRDYPTVVDVKKNNIEIGPNFLFNGDILIPTESLSEQGFEWIRDSKVYTSEKLDELYKEKKQHVLDAPREYIVTKHMYWPVLQGQLSALPVWNDNYPDSYREYAGYETWNTLVAVDPTGKQAGQTQPVEYLYGILNYDSTKMNSVKADAKVYSIEDFYYHQVTKEEWQTFTDADKAIINASSYWAYNKPFGPGDYLITVAMHVNTKEVPTWALQTVWWSDNPNAGKYAANRPSLPQAQGPWDHYKMATSYGIVDPVTQKQPVAMNPYIELVIHPIATNCNNCHSRAGWPAAQAGGIDSASYQNPNCKDLLAKLTPESPCLENYLLTDFQWIIPDRAIAEKK